MSVQAPTTFSHLPLELEDEILECLDPATLKKLEGATQSTRKRVHSFYLNQIGRNGDLVAAYQTSQEDPLQPPDLKRRAISLIEKTEDLLGGPLFLERISQQGQASLLHPDSQSQMMRSRWNCKVIGLVPILKQIPGSEDFLREVAAMQADADKYRAMERWIQSHPREVGSVESLQIAGFKERHAAELVQSTFFQLGGGKIYNFLPKVIRYFTGLKRLSLTNNYLNQLPKELGQLPLEILEIGQNYLIKMPPAVPTLRELRLDSNREPLSSRQILSFIEEYIDNGGKEISIFFDQEYFERNELRDLESSTHEIRVELIGDQTVFSVKEKTL